jgi:hypothetical protein
MAAESSVGPQGGGFVGTPHASGYVALLEIARGGMGTVGLAVRAHEHFTRLFAVKRLHAHIAQNPEARAAFLQEGRVAALLRHPSAVSVFDVGEDDVGPYLVMEYVEGAPVSALITAARRRGELLPVQICLRACLQAAQALHAAHELVDHRGKPHGFLHRDVSPQNILVGFDGLARLTDFGVAQTIFTDQQTFSGTLKGKLRYMAPERLRFEPVDRRSDLFSLGVVLYEMLSSEHLFDAEGETEIAQQVLHAPTPDIGLVREGVPLAVVELLFQLLARDPAYRPASAAAVAERLDAALTELEFEQGKAPTELYMEDHFGQERRERQQQVSEALGRVSAGLSRARAASRFGLATVLGSRHRAVVALVAAALALAGLLWLGWAVLQPGSASVAQPVRVSPEPRSRADPVRAAPRAQPAAEPGASASATVLVALPAQLDQPSAADSGGRAGRAPRPARPPLPRRTAASAQPSPPSPRCNPPFYYDEHGVKRVRKECF